MALVLLMLPLVLGVLIARGDYFVVGKTRKLSGTMRTFAVMCLCSPVIMASIAAILANDRSLFWSSDSSYLALILVADTGCVFIAVISALLFSQPSPAAMSGTLPSHPD